MISIVSLREACVFSAVFDFQKMYVGGKEISWKKKKSGSWNLISISDGLCTEQIYLSDCKILFAQDLV